MSAGRFADKVAMRRPISPALTFAVTFTRGSLHCALRFACALHAPSHLASADGPLTATSHFGSLKSTEQLPWQPAEHVPLQVPLHWPAHWPPAAPPAPPACACPWHCPSHAPLHVPSQRPVHEP